MEEININDIKKNGFKLSVKDYSPEKENKNVPYSGKITKSMDKAIEILAKEKMVSKHDIVRTALSQYIEQNRVIIESYKKSIGRTSNMKEVVVINGWSIREKEEDQVPSFLPLERRFGVFAPDGRFMEDNLTKEEAEEFAKENLDWVE